MIESDSTTSFLCTVLIFTLKCSHAFLSLPWSMFFVRFPRIDASDRAARECLLAQASIAAKSTKVTSLLIALVRAGENPRVGAVTAEGRRGEAGRQSGGRRAMRQTLTNT